MSAVLNEEIDTSTDVFAFPASVQQRRFWFADQFVEGLPLFNIPMALQLEGALDRDALHRSVHTLIHRHESLRTTFIKREGEVLQIVTSSLHIQMPIHDLRHLNHNEQHKAVMRMAQEEANRPFDTAQESLIRTTLLFLSQNSHILLLNLHHLIFDGWSAGIFAKELNSCYTAYTQDDQPILPNLPIQYPDYSIWQQQWLQSKAIERKLSFWKDKLSGQLPVFPVLSSRTRPSTQSYKGTWEPVFIPSGLCSQLKSLAVSEKSTLFTVLMAAFKVLVYRYSGHTDIILGSPVANRHRPELEGLIGLFINTLAYRNDLSGSPGFRELLARVRQTVLEALEHQEVPFEQLVEELNIERDVSHQVLVQATFSLQDMSFAPELGSLSVSDFWEAHKTGDFQATTSKFELSVILSDRQQEGIQGIVEYSTDLYTSEEIRRLWQHYLVLLQEIVDQPDAPISRLSILTESEKHQQLVQWQGPVVEIPDSTNLKTLFEEQAAQRPGKVAVVCEEESITYQELNSRANQLAHYLREQGAGTDILVGICIDRSIEMVIAMLATVKAGAAYMPMDPSLPAERLSYMLNDSEAQLLIAHSDVDVPDHQVETIYIDTDSEQIAHYAGDNPSHTIAPESLIYVIYTSGSTGRPKGVELPHRAFSNFLFECQQRPGITADGVGINATTFSFDIAGSEIFLPLISGAQLVVVPRATTLDGKALAEVLDRHQATYMQGTPASWRLLLDAGWQGLPELRITTGGEALSASLREELVGKVGALWNMYGPTETTIWSTGHLVGTGDESTPIGRPVNNTTAYILDEHLQPMPVGVTGRLYIGGAGLARGYRNRPELTQAKFIDNPHGAGRLYHTGDLARWTLEGRLEFVGREDDQVKIRGFRVELGEIEEVLQSVVGESVVMLREDIPGEHRLVGYIKTKQPLNQQGIRDSLREWLPDYMVPHIFVGVDYFPTTPNGKVDKAALPLPGPVVQTKNASYVAPRNETEAQLVQIWEEVLGIKQIGIHDDFFDLGGHSFLAMEVAKKIEHHFQCKIAVIEVFQKPTIARFSERILKGRAKKGSRILMPEQKAAPLKQKDNATTFAINGTCITPDMLMDKMRSLGISKGDTLFIHSSLAVLGRIDSEDEELPADMLIEAFKQSVGETGTIILPTFTYSFLDEEWSGSIEPFDVEKSRSRMGILSERFRHGKNVIRTHHPTHSVAIWGHKQAYFAEVDSTTFGKGSIFGKLHDVDATLVGVGFHLPGTFVHYIESEFRVPYRTYETLSGTVIHQQKASQVDIRFFKKEEHYTDIPTFPKKVPSFSTFKRAALGGDQLTVVSTTEVFDKAWKALKKDVNVFSKKLTSVDKLFIKAQNAIGRR